MPGIVTQQRVYDFVEQNPGATPQDIADTLKVSVSQVKTRLLLLLNKRKVDRVVEKSKVDSMYYYPMRKKNLV